MARKNFNQPSTTRQQSKFANVPSVGIKRSRIDRSHGHKTTIGKIFGEQEDLRNDLCPVYVDEVLPGDTFNMKATQFARTATPIHPVMDNLNLDLHFFFVPYRLLWDNWQQFMGERRNPDDDPNDYTLPQVSCGMTRADAPVERDGMSLSAYMGLPMTSENGNDIQTLMVNSLPFRAYRLIWNEWYRDENLQDAVTVPLGDGPDSGGLSSQLLPRGKRKDYFTSALPWPQKGDPVHIPFGHEMARVEGSGLDDPSPVETTSGGLEYRDPIFENSAGDIRLALLEDTIENTATINDLRTAFQIQKLLERDARGGTRYTELIQSHFNVTSPDSRLQRPEYLGGGTTRVTQNPVSNTAGETTPQGELASYGTAVNQATFGKSFTEHGVILGLASYRADLTYQRGVDRMWSRQTRYDFFWPALAHLGEQAILNKEIQYRGDPNWDENVFGYQERYAEYRYKPSRVTGIFNSDTTQSLDSWHYAQDFAPDAEVNLNEDFIKELPPIDRTIAVPSQPFFLCDFWFDLKCDRPMPMYAVPGMVDHF